jgi:hypothetical protein
VGRAGAPATPAPAPPWNAGRAAPEPEPPVVGRKTGPLGRTGARGAAGAFATGAALPAPAEGASLAAGRAGPFEGLAAGFPCGRGSEEGGVRLGRGDPLFGAVLGLLDAGRGG